MPRPPCRILRRAAGGLADFADGAARSKNSDHPVRSSLEKKQRGWPKDYFIIRPRTGVLHAPVYCLAASQGLARCTLPSAFPLRCAYVLHAAAGGLAQFSPCGGAPVRRRRTVPSSQGVSAVAPGALLASMAADGVLSPGDHTGNRGRQQQAIPSVQDAYALSPAWYIGCASASPAATHFLTTWRQLSTSSAACPPTHARWRFHWGGLPSAYSTARACLSRGAPRVRALPRPFVTT